MFQLCKLCHPDIKPEDLRTIYIFNKLRPIRASNLPKYSRNVLKFELFRQIFISLLQTKFRTNRIKITTFIVYQPNKATDRQTYGAYCYIPFRYS